MESLLEKLSRTFHQNHFIILSLKQRILAVYRKEVGGINPQRKLLQRMVELCTEVLHVLEIVEPGISRLKGITIDTYNYLTNIDPYLCIITSSV